MAFTYFFRDSNSLELAVKHVVPAGIGSSRIRVWDAGCAMGPEPYTLAILFAEAMGRFAYKNVWIDATDVDGSNLFGEIIARGVYTKEQLDRIPTVLLERYFRQVEGSTDFVIDQRVRDRIHYQKHDLLSLKAPGSGYSLIVCKNVLLHFTAEERVEVLRMYHGALEQDGILVVEQTQKMPEELTGMFERVSADAQVFRRRELVVASV